MPPETLTEGVVSRATDIYSFGVLMWQMYHSSRPWSGMTHAQIITKVAVQHSKLQWITNADAGWVAVHVWLSLQDRQLGVKHVKHD